VLGNVRCRPSLAADPARVEGAAADALFFCHSRGKTATGLYQRRQLIGIGLQLLRDPRVDSGTEGGVGVTDTVHSARVARFGPDEREDLHASPAAR
jgi:hypothetical protein